MSDPAPTWLDEFVQRIPNDAMRTDFLRYWGRLKKHNENDELLVLVNFMGVLTAIMSTLPQEALRIARELPRDPSVEQLNTCREGWEKFLVQLREPTVSKRLDTLGAIMQSLERFGRGFELRLLLAIVIPSYVAGAATIWLLMHLAH
jgi:hypothetical protein